ncbi:phosphotransferase family protein [Massilia putida]|uniref:phosphotransferase family protein n=1 Tax=Massilia putida TaxID=1141883 RepID=UPI000951E80E|nr:phosphotransferase family protein [Massilia putida]
MSETPTPIPDQARLRGWLEAHLGPAPGFEIVPLQGGASNLIYKVTLGAATYALRRPPLVGNDPTSNNLLREMRLLRALAQTTIPHTRLVLGCEQPDVIGAPFELLEWHAGFAAKAPLPPGFEQPEARRRMAFELVDALATVSNADWRAIGLDGFGKPEGFLERQVERWLTQLERYRVRNIPSLDRLALWLRENTPEMQRASLVHGDYQFINVMYEPALPVRLSAIVDWESATIGDPLLDLGWMLAGWQEPGEEASFASYIDWHGFPGRRELAERYAAATGLSLQALGYYMALAMFKLGIIMEGAYARYVKGRSTLPLHARMEHDVPMMIARGLRFSQAY